MERSKTAVCATCPYYAEPTEDSEYGDCNLKPEPRLNKPAQWCGQHPDFDLSPQPADRLALVVEQIVLDFRSAVARRRP